MTEKQEKIRYFINNSILAGICIAIGGYVNLILGSPIGPFLFAFGLCCVLGFKYFLFTGKAGTWDFNQIFYLIGVLLLNIVGCFLIGCLSKYNPNVGESAIKITEARLANGWFNTGLSAIGCGAIMTFCVVGYANTKSFIIPLIGVPVFIFCGFAHCVADAFYYSALPWDYMKEHIIDILPVYGATVVGNYIGCNIPKIFSTNITEKKIIY